MRNFIAAIVLALLPLGTAGAQAHAFLDHAEPRVGSTVASAPREVSLSFTQDLEAAFSSVQVSDAKGTRVDQGNPQVSASVMRIGLKPLPPGTYKVRWRALSVDTHTTEGTFSFRIGP
jgi:methionine-rich copper-binding protein CopC